MYSCVQCSLSSLSYGSHWTDLVPPPALSQCSLSTSGGLKPSLITLSSIQSESNQVESSVQRDESPMDVDQPSPTTQDTQSIG